METENIQQKTVKDFIEQTKSNSMKTAKKSKHTSYKIAVEDIKSKKIDVKKAKSNKFNERKQIEFALRLLRQGKTKSEAAELTGIKSSKLDLWYDEGKKGKNENTVYFFNEINKIKNQNNEVKENSKVETNESVIKIIMTQITNQI